MNDFPSMEDRAARVVAENLGSASVNDGTNRMNGNFIRTGLLPALVQTKPYDAS